VFRQSGEKVSFCSRDKAKAAEFQQRYGGEAAYGDLTTALAHPDIRSCVICVPHDLHEAYSSAAVAANRHVLLEKPLAHTMASAERIVKLAGGPANDKVFMLAEQMDYLPVLANVQRLADPSRYTFTDHNTYEPRGWRLRLPESGGGVMLDLGIHYVSFAVKAFGPIASHRRETLQTISGTDVPSRERLLIRHAGGVEGEVDVAWLQPAVSRRMEVKTRSASFLYEPDSRFARLGAIPQFVCWRSANGREQMTAEYLARCRSARPVSDIADALPVLAAVL
jgi:predicted dehydrogenase